LIFIGRLVIKSEHTQNSPWIKRGIYLSLFVGLLLLYRYLPLDEWITSFRIWVKELGALGWIISIFGYAIASFILIPGALLTITAGIAFGLWGFFIVVIGATIGAGMSFLAARYLFSKPVEKSLGQKPLFKALNEAIKEEGWKVVGLMRFSPAMPFSLQNWLFGVTAVKFFPYLIATFFGIMPGTLLYVWIGSIGGSAAAGAETSTAKYIFLIVGIIATLAVTILIGRKAKEKLKVHGLDEE
jgi:uncharacterized membrane protein YdjX (TVP38/TMEM64 family)